MVITRCFENTALETENNAPEGCSSSRKGGQSASLCLVVGMVGIIFQPHSDALN